MKNREHAREASTASDDHLTQIGNDLDELYTHVGSAVRDGADDVKQRWDTMRQGLEEKRSTMVVRAQELKSAGKAASSDLKSGFESAYSELKEAIKDARDKFA